MPSTAADEPLDLIPRKEAEAERDRLIRELKAARAEAEEQRAEQVRARQAAEATVAELEAIFHSVADALYVGDINGIRRANEPALAALGYDSVEELNRHIGTLAEEIQTRRVTTGEPIPAEGQAFAHALQGRVDVQEVLIRHRKTGQDRVVRSCCAPIRVGDQVVGAVAINTDITEAKQAASALRERADFEQQLIGIVSHDLRDPLGAIHLGTATLLRQEGHDSRTLKTLLRIQSNAERGARMIEDLLDFTQARLGGGIPVRLREVDLHELTRQAVADIRMVHVERDVHLRQNGDVTGSWDPDRLSQVLTNLLTNAVKYSPADTPVTVVTRAEDNESIIEVHNQGPAISPELLGRLFEPLRRGWNKAAPLDRSVGLGLYIVDHLVQAHGGTIGVVSTPEEGTTFTVRLPRQQNSSST